MMETLTGILLAAVLAGFALLRVELDGTFLSSVEPIVDVIGILAVLVFSFVLIYRAAVKLWGK